MPIHNVADAMREMQAGSKHIKSRAQAIAIGMKAEGKSTSSRKKIQKKAFSAAKERVGMKE